MDDKYANPMQFLANLLGDAGLLPTPSKVSPVLPALDEAQRVTYDEFCLRFLTPANLRHYTAWQLIEAAYAAGANSTKTNAE